MMEYGDLLADRGRRRSEASRFRPAAMVLAPLLAILFQVYVPLFFEYLGYLELPLLVTVYFASMRRRPVSGMLYGSAVGLLQDSLSDHPLGVFGITKTLVGYAAATMSLRVETDRVAARFVAASAFFFVHQLVYWLLIRALLGSTVEFSAPQTLLLGLMNGAVAVPLFHLLDKLKETG